MEEDIVSLSTYEELKKITTQMADLVDTIFEKYSFVLIDPEIVELKRRLNKDLELFVKLERRNKEWFIY